MFACKHSRLFLMAQALFSLALFPFSSLCAQTSESGCLTYGEALEWALNNAPPLKVSELEIEARQAEELQAGLWPNPIFSVEYETGEGGHCGWDGAEVTFGITQEIELGGKCCAEREVQRMSTIEAMWDLESQKLDLTMGLADAFIEASLWQEKARLAEQQLQLARQMQECVQEKVQHGKLSPLKKSKSLIDCRQKQLTLIKAKNQWELAKKKGALLCEGLARNSFECISYPFFVLQPLPGLKELEEGLQNSPEWAKSELSIAAAATTTHLEKKQRYPDLEVSAGVCSCEKFHENSFFVELSIPLPVFNRNQGNIERAYAKENQAWYIKEMAQLEMRSRLSGVYSEWERAYGMARELKCLIESEAESVKSLQEGYSQGKFEKSGFSGRAAGFTGTSGSIPRSFGRMPS